MSLNKEVIESIKPNISSLNFIKINEENIENLAEILGNTSYSHWDSPFIFSGDDKKLVNYFAIFSCLSFCYWKEPQWFRVYDNKILGGSNSLFLCLNDAIKNGYDITDVDCIESLDFSVFKSLLKTQDKFDIPYAYERFLIIKEIGAVLKDSFGGTFVNLFEENMYNVNKVHNELISKFTCLSDKHIYKNTSVKFYKKSQEIIALIYEYFRGKSFGAFINMEELTSSSDYRLPEILSNYGVIEYRNGLEQKILNKETLLGNSIEASEIRMATIYSCYLIQKTLEKKSIYLRQFEISNLIWTAAQDIHNMKFPFPRIDSVWV